MPSLDNELVDLVQEFRCQQADVVFEGLKVVADITECAVAQHLANGVVLVHQFMQAVIVAIQIKSDHATDKNRPQGHAGASVGLTHLRCDSLLQQLEYRRTKRNIRVHELQTSQYLGDIVT